MGVQAHACRGDWDGVFDAAYVPRRGYWMKPCGFWTSSMREDGTTGWQDFSENEPGLDLLYEPMASARLLVLETDRDLLATMLAADLCGESNTRDSAVAIVNASDAYSEDKQTRRSSFCAQDSTRLLLKLTHPENMNALWKWASGIYDAVHVPMYERYPASILAAWDVESTTWFRPLECLTLMELSPIPHP